MASSNTTPRNHPPQVEALLSQIDERLTAMQGQPHTDWAELDMAPLTRMATPSVLNAPSPSGFGSEAQRDGGRLHPSRATRMALPRQQRHLSAVAVLAAVAMAGVLAWIAHDWRAQADVARRSADAALAAQHMAGALAAPVTPDGLPALRSLAQSLTQHIDSLQTAVDAAPEHVATSEGMAKVRPALAKLQQSLKAAPTDRPAAAAQEAALALQGMEAAWMQAAQAVANAPDAPGAAATAALTTGPTHIVQLARDALQPGPAGTAEARASALRSALSDYQQALDAVVAQSNQTLAVVLAPLVQQFNQAAAKAQHIVDAVATLGTLPAPSAAPLAQEAQAVLQPLLQMRSAIAEPQLLSWLQLAAMAAALALAAGSLWMLLRGLASSQQGRMREAQLQAERSGAQEREAKRVNEANQAAILRLMNELQGVAEGDLTQKATVSEDITGAIADSVNYTVEELRTLVGQVQGVAGQVTVTTGLVEQTSTELLATSGEQLREIHETGEAVLRMAERINDISGQAEQSASVARESLQAAGGGREAVSASIAAMSQLRDSIQDTAKRIKRLGESSQEIGEITEWISGITEQTQVLALNAAIQATAAGEAGRGFTVIAQEVQRLSERAAQATGQISGLVQTIQQDTQSAVGAMEQSIQSVVKNAQLTDAAGNALAEIDRVTRELAELIERISAQSRQEADAANVVATNIQHIFAVTEQTSDGTRSTAQMVHELARMAQDLRQSVDRFKIQ